MEEKTRYHDRNKTTAGLLAIFLGGFGVHRFYLGQTAQGFLYLVFFWSFVPAFIGLIDGIGFFNMPLQTFDEKYNYRP